MEYFPHVILVSLRVFFSIQNVLMPIVQMLREHRFYAKFSKCEFWLNEIIFLGHVISADGIAVDPEQLKSFLGLAS